MMTLEEKLKKCSSCSRELPLTEFYTDKSKASGYKSACKSCIRSKKRESSKRKVKVKPRKEVNKSILSPQIECKNCHKMLDPSKFYQRNNKVIQTCIECRKQNRKEEYQPRKDKDELDAENLEACLEAIVQITTGLKKCKKCHIWKEYPQFKKRDSSISGRSNICTSCSNISRNENISQNYIKARKALDERNQKIIKLTLKHKGTIK